MFDSYFDFDVAVRPAEIKKEFKEHMHPRGKDGKFIDKISIDRAAGSVSAAASLFEKVSSEDAGKLKVELMGLGMKPEDMQAAIGRAEFMRLPDGIKGRAGEMWKSGEWSGFAEAAKEEGFDPDAIDAYFAWDKAEAERKQRAIDERIARARDWKRDVPDGMPNNPQVETPEFKQWFGDSKIVNEDGSPRVLYHGTRADFTEFKVPDKGLTNEMIGIHLGKDPAITDAFTIGTYARNSRAWGPGDDAVKLDDGKLVHPGGNVLPVYVRMEKPFIVPRHSAMDQSAISTEVFGTVFEDDEDAFVHYATTMRNADEADARAIYQKLKNDEPISSKENFALSVSQKSIDKTGSGLKAFASEYGLEFGPEYNGQDWGSYAAKKYVKIMQDRGYDGLIYENTSTNEIGFDDKIDPVSYIVFDPRNIKSARGNSGEFDRNNPDIRKEFRGEIRDRDGDGLIYDGTEYERAAPAASDQDVVLDLRYTSGGFVTDREIRESASNVEKAAMLLQRIREADHSKAMGAMIEAGMSDGDVDEAQYQARLAKYRQAKEGRRGGDDIPADLSDDEMRSQIESPEFRRWFGDSKIVGDDGSPLVLFHGTPKGDFSEFDLGKGGSSTPMYWGKGVYLTPYREYAEGFARQGGHEESDSRIMEVYASIQNPFVIDRSKLGQEGYMKIVRENIGKNPDDVAREFVSKGYDGIVIKDGDGSVQKDGIEIVVFDTTKLKSARKNSGAFDPNNPNINKSFRGDIRDADGDGLIYDGTKYERAAPQGGSRVWEGHTAMGNWGRGGASGVIVVAADTGRVLVDKRSPYVSGGAGAYGTFGGAIPGPHIKPLDSALAELEEEAGYRGEISAVMPALRYEDKRDILEDGNPWFYQNYIVVVPTEFEAKSNAGSSWESGGGRWMDFGELAAEKNVHPGLAALIENSAEDIRTAPMAASSVEPGIREAVKSESKAAGLLMRSDDKESTAVSLMQAGAGEEHVRRAMNLAAWFDGSKAVDDEGNPKVLYHGTPEDFTEFDTSMDLGEERDKAAFFTDDPQVASGYAYSQSLAEKKRIAAYRDLTNERDDLGRELWDRNGQGRMPERDGPKQGMLNDMLDREVITREEYDRFNAIEDRMYSFWEDNPIPVDEYGDEEKSPNIKPVYLRMLNPAIVDARGGSWDYIVPHMLQEVDRKKHDGIIFQNVVDNPNGAEFTSTSYAVFNGFQVKSAIGNDGEYDAKYRDITKEFRAHEHPRDRWGKFIDAGLIEQAAHDGVMEEKLRGVLRDGDEVAFDRDLQAAKDKQAVGVPGTLPYNPDDYRVRRHQSMKDGRTIDEVSAADYMHELNREGKRHADDFMDPRDDREELGWMKIENYPVLVAEKDGVQYRRDNRPIKYVAHDADGEISRDETGMATYLSEDEMRAEGLPLVDGTLTAFRDGKPIGFTGDSFGAIELYVNRAERGNGIGSELSYLYRKDNPFKTSGGFTAGGERTAEKTYWRMVHGKVPGELTALRGQLGDIGAQVHDRYENVIRPMNAEKKRLEQEFGGSSDEVIAHGRKVEQAWEDMRAWEIEELKPKQDAIKEQIERIRSMTPAEARAVLPSLAGHVGITKAFKEHEHPRGDNGRFVSKVSMDSAAKSVDKASQLFARVTKPSDRKMLVAALKERGMSKADISAAMKGAKGKSVAGKKAKVSRPKVAEKVPSKKTKAELAKVAAVYVGKDVQRYSEERNEPILASGIGGMPLANNEPADVVVAVDGKIKHGIELKTMTVGARRKLTMKRDAIDRKRAWERKNRAPMHTIVFDDTEVYNANGPGQHDESKRKMFYRRGYGSFRVDTMHEVKSMDELKQLLGMPPRKLPKRAK